MAAKSPVRQHLVSTIAAIEKHNGPGDKRLTDLRAKLATENIADHIRKVVDAAPPLSASQRERLALLLHPGNGVLDG
jgi:hypothetical protein